LPLLFAVVVYVCPFTVTLTALNASAVPVIVGVLSFVNTPFTTGATGAVASITKLDVVGEEVLPAASVDVVVAVYVPVAKVLVVTLQLPDPFAVVVYVDPFTLTVIELLFSDVPVIVGVGSFVDTKFTTGDDGGVVSITKLDVVGEEVLPAASVDVTVTVYVPSVVTIVGFAVTLQLPPTVDVVVKVVPLIVNVIVVLGSDDPSYVNALIPIGVTLGAVGDCVSTLNVFVPLTEVLPAASVDVAVTVYVPSDILVVAVTL
jgi:hypothetical protein